MKYTPNKMNEFHKVYSKHKVFLTMEYDMRDNFKINTKEGTHRGLCCVEFRLKWSLPYNFPLFPSPPVSPPYNFFCPIQWNCECHLVKKLWKMYMGYFHYLGVIHVQWRLFMNIRANCLSNLNERYKSFGFMHRL